ncbi:MAG: bifunctional riboflavin kinase/FAD synthetase [Anaerolineales bacterium]
MQQLPTLQGAQLSNTWLTIGVFDGVHLGHQKILKDLAAAAHAHGAAAVVLSFQPHPVEVLRGPLKYFYLSSPEGKAEQIAALGIDTLITQPFTKTFSQTSARDFVSLLVGQLGMKQLWVGHDFALGHNREGDLPALVEFGKELGFSVHSLDAVRLHGDIVSSSRIRALLVDGDVDGAARFLGRPYSLAGQVASGAGRGRGIGIPTANLAVGEKRALPATGVYVTWATLGARRWGSLTNIGVRPTFADQPAAPIVEAHLLEYDGGEFYGQTLRLDFITRLRAEQKFSGVEALLAQIHRDIEAGRQVLTSRADGWWNETLP